MASARGRGCARQAIMMSLSSTSVTNADDVPDVAAAMRTAGAWLRGYAEASIRRRSATASFTAARNTTARLWSTARSWRTWSATSPLAPLHQPNNLAPIRALLERFPKLPQVACFDTAFHRGHSAVADHFAIPEHFYAEGVRRYGFHGLSYEYVAGRLREVAPDNRQAPRDRRASRQRRVDVRAPWRAAASKAPWASPHLTDCRWARGPARLDPGVVLYLIAEKQ